MTDALLDKIANEVKLPAAVVRRFYAICKAHGEKCDFAQLFPCKKTFQKKSTRRDY